MLARFVLQFSGSKSWQKPTLASYKLSDSEMQSKYQAKIDEKLYQGPSLHLDIQ